MCTHALFLGLSLLSVQSNLLTVKSQLAHLAVAQRAAGGGVTLAVCGTPSALGLCNDTPRPRSWAGLGPSRRG